MTRAQSAPPCNELSEDARGYAAFTDGSCYGMKPSESCTGQVIESAEADGESSQLVEVKAI